MQFTARFVRRAALRAALAGAGAAAAAAASPRRWGDRATAVATAATAGAAMEHPAAGAVVGLASAAAWTRSRGPRTGRSTIGGVAAGISAAAATTRLWPVAPRTPAEIRPALTPLDGQEPSEDGGGLTIVVNPTSGPAHRSSPVEELTEALPAAKVLELGDSLDLATALRQAGSGSALAVGIAGGDGTVSAAAAVAHAAEKPLVVVPSGTLNHLARDLGVRGVDDAVAALRAGRTVAVDLGVIDGKTFVNTASFGAYTELVDARERLEQTLGKWPAMLVALFHVLRHSTPVDVELDGTRRSIWMIFIGNCQYQPDGFAPSWRERLDDRQLDIRLVDAAHPFARTRLLLAVLTGRLGRSVVYEAFSATSLHVRSLDGPLRLARDGETFDGSAEFDICKEPRPLAVYVPEPEGS